LESNGPDVKIRGTAAQIYEKYSQYARDAQSGGDRVKYENYLQHAEHYFRVMAATMPRDQRPPMMQQGEGGGQPQPVGSEEREAEEVSADPMKVVDDAEDDGDEFEGDEGAEAGEEEEVEASGGRPQGQSGQDDRQEGGSGRRRRRRRGRNHEGQGQGGQGSGGDRNGGGDNETRSALDSLARRQGALAGG
jgi:hypothetical protein